MKSTINERFKKAVNVLKTDGRIKSQADLAAKLGYQTSYLSDLSNGRFEFSEKFTKKLEDEFSVSAEWLFSGEGEMIKAGQASGTNTSDLDGYRLVPVYNFDAVGGMNASNEITDAPAYIERYVPFVGAREDDLCVHVTGNSMIPTYSPGSLVLVREVFGWRDYFGYGHCFVLFLNDGRRILKEIQKSETAPGDNVLCVSHNHNVQAEELPKKIIRKVYKVIMALTNEGF